MDDAKMLAAEIAKVDEAEKLETVTVEDLDWV